MNTNDTDARIRALPCWGKPAAIDWQPLSGGLSNDSYQVSDGSDRYVARFGDDYPFHHVSREREIMATRAAFAAGFAPELVYARPGVMVSRFIDGNTYDEACVRADLDRVCDLIKRFHTVMPHQISGPGYLFWVFHVIRDYARQLREHSRLRDRLDAFLALAEELEAAQVALPLIYGHHDLLPANFIDDGERLWLIDFEYAGFGTAMFDVAGIAANASCDEQQAAHLLARYFATDTSSDAVTSTALQRSFIAMQCASLLRETMWSLVSELRLNVPGVDYVAYTDENIVRLDAAVERYRNQSGEARR